MSETRNLTDADVIAAIRRRHLKANIELACYVRHYWKLAWVDVGGTIFGLGPYVHLPVDCLVRDGSRQTARVTIRVYAPARLRRRLARDWRPSPKRQVAESLMEMKRSHRRKSSV